MRDSGNEENVPVQPSALYNCPVCGCGIDMRAHQDNIPYFGDILEVSIVCNCGFKYVDVIILGQKEPLRHSKKISCESDLCTRVIRSTSGTIRIPEWGIDIEPGPASESYITNVEGIIERLQSIVNMAKKWSETDEERQRAEALLGTMSEARDGKADFTIVIEDPLGNSAFIGDGVEVTKLSDEEAESLGTGIFIIQK
jgi:zinc finger protein